MGGGNWGRGASVSELFFLQKAGPRSAIGRAPDS